MAKRFVGSGAARGRPGNSWKGSLSTGYRRLIEVMQRMNFGRIKDLHVRGGEPVFDPPPSVLRDCKLGKGQNGSRPELDRADFELKREVIDLYEQLEQIGDGVVANLEIQGGLPVRMTVEENAR
jgi:hypothetical protein